VTTLNSAALLTVASAVFVAELTDKDAFLLLTLATRRKSWFVFAAGSLAFAITTTIITTSGYLLARILPVFWIKLAGGIVMISYGLWEFLKTSDNEERRELKKEGKLLSSSAKSMWPAFFTAVSMLALLDLSGDATEVLTIIFVAHFQDALLVFVGALSALIAATAFETFLGSQLRRILSLNRLRILSILIFLALGTGVIVTTIL
jgi:putative Ca2+/H+ antiporter (TMEM165/GDT1 family)